MAKLTPIKFSQLEQTPSVDGSEIIPIVKGGENAAVLVSVLLANKVSVSDLATVAFTGSYNDLIDKPVIPTVPVLSVNNRVGNVVGLAEATDLQALETSVQQELDTKVNVPNPLIPKILIGTTLESNVLGDVGYDDAPSPMTMAFRGFGGTLKAADPQDNDDLVTKQWAITELSTKESLSNKGVANGYAPLDATAKVPSIYLPSYVDDVQDFPSFSDFPATGSTGVIYVANDTNKTYRWSGSSYIEISPSPGTTDALAEGIVNLYYTDSRADARIAASTLFVKKSGDNMTGSLYIGGADGAAPAAPFQIDGSAGTLAFLKSSSTLSRISFRASGSTSNTGVAVGAVGDSLILRAGSADVITVTSGALTATGINFNVGGTTISSSNITPLAITSTAASSAGAGGGITVIVDDGAAMASGDRLGYLLYGGLVAPSNRYNSAGMVVYAAEDWSLTNRGSYIAFEYTAVGAAGRRAGVRIGDPAVTAALYVVGETNTSTAYALRAMNSSNANIFNVRNDGKVIIGSTAAASGLLHLKALVESDTPLLGAASGDVSNAAINFAAADNIVRWGIRLGGGTTNGLFLDYRDSSSGAAIAMLAFNREGQMGVRTTPTHTVTLGSNSTGMVFYNTAQQTTNYERYRMIWSSNVFNIVGEFSGTGSTRSILLSPFGVGSTNSLRVNSSSATGFVQSSGSSNAPSAIIHAINGTLSGTGATQYALSIETTINQTSAGSYTGIHLDMTETSVGSGVKRLIDLQVDGSTKFAVDNTGKITSSLAQTYNATNVTSDRAFDANATTVDELADVLGTLISDLRALGLVS